MKKPCSYPGCSALLAKGGYCEAHKASAPKRHTLYNKHVRAKDPALALAHKIRKSAKWLRIRKQVLADYPLCADPFGEHARQGVTRTADQVHHVAGIVDHPELWNQRENLQALCTTCHARIERGVRINAKNFHPTPQSQSPQEWSPFG